MTSFLRCLIWTLVDTKSSKMIGRQRTQLSSLQTSSIFSQGARVFTLLKPLPSTTQRNWLHSSLNCQPTLRSTSSASLPTTLPAQTLTWKGSLLSTRPSIWCQRPLSHRFCPISTIWLQTSSRLTFQDYRKLTMTSLWSLWSLNANLTLSS